MHSTLKRRKVVTAEGRGEDAPGRGNLEYTDHHPSVAVSVARVCMSSLRRGACPVGLLYMCFPVSPYQLLRRSVRLVPILRGGH